MDRSLLLLTPHLAEASGGQGPLVADAFNTAYPKKQSLLNCVFKKESEYLFDILCGQMSGY